MKNNKVKMNVADSSQGRINKIKKYIFWCLLIIIPLILSERKGKTFEVYNEHISEKNYDRKIWVARDPRHFKRNA